MADVTQVKSELLSHQELIHGTDLAVVGSALDVLGDISALVYIYHANVEVTANATGVSYLIQVNHTPGSDKDWITVEEIVTSTDAAQAEVLGAAEGIGDTVIEVASTTGLAALGKIYFQDATSVATSEWNQIASIVANTSVTLMSGLTVAKEQTNDTIFTAETFVRYIDLTGVPEMRAVVVHSAATGANIRSEVQALRFTDFV